MATTRERREARRDRRLDWAEGREAKAKSAGEVAQSMADAMPLGEPIHDGARGRRQRSAIKRLHSKTSQAVEHSQMARRHRDTAAGIEDQLERSIFSDDLDAIERLQERIAENEAKREEMKTRNAEFRKAHRERLKEMTAFQREGVMPHPPFELSNLGARINRDRKRLAELGQSQTTVGAAVS